jgi:hypothetical protein
MNLLKNHLDFLVLHFYVSRRASLNERHRTFDEWDAKRGRFLYKRFVFSRTLVIFLFSAGLATLYIEILHILT